MLSKNKIKFIHSLQIKKYREAYQQFIVEGEKIVTELLLDNSQIFKINLLITTKNFIETVPPIVLKKIDEIIEATPDDIKKISTLITPGNVIAIVEIPQLIADPNEITSNLSLLLENIQDPGNLGTIIRTADWFGIKNIFCSPGCVDTFNPKVVQATMGSFLRVKVHLENLSDLIKKYSQKGLAVYGAFLEGKSIYEETVSKNGFIVMGNEANGISDGLKKIIPNKIFIPPHPKGHQAAESLNVSIATAVICSEFRRQF